MPADPELRVEPLRDDQWAHWRDLRLEALQDTPIGFLERYDDAVRRSDEEWQEVPRRSGVQLLLWEGDRPVGMCGGFVDAAGRPTAYAVYLTPAARGRGGLGLLVETLVDWARGLGSTQLLLEVHEDNARALASYTRLGFSLTGERQPYALDPSRDELEMRRPL